MAVKRDALSKPSALSKETVSDSSDDDVDTSASESVDISPSSRGAKVSTSSSSSSEEDSSDESSSKPTSQKTPKVAKPAKEKQNKPAPTVVATIPAKGYKPPSGFSKVNQDNSSSTSVGCEMLSDITGKQVWHITAPASLPISCVKEFTMTAVGRDTPIANHRGREYGLAKVTKQSADHDSLLLPAGNNGTFEQQAISFSQDYQIYELPKEGNSSSESSERVPTSVTTIIPGKYAKPVRKQPLGLRMRYKPFGTDESPIGGMGGSDESETDADGFIIPHQLPSPPSESPKKKKKRHHRESGSGDEHEAMDVDQLEAPSSQTKHSSSQKSKEKKDKTERKEEKDKKKRKKRNGEASQET